MINPSSHKIESNSKKEIRTLNQRIDELEKEIQNLKDNFNNIYKVFFREDLTNK